VAPCTSGRIRRATGIRSADVALAGLPQAASSSSTKTLRGRRSASVGASTSPRSLASGANFPARLAWTSPPLSYAPMRAISGARAAGRGCCRGSPPKSTDSLSAKLSANQRTLGANIGDPPHAADATLIPIPKQRFCPDTEEVTGQIQYRPPGFSLIYMDSRQGRTAPSTELRRGVTVVPRY
jgi:hypothetical protein